MDRISILGTFVIIYLRKIFLHWRSVVKNLDRKERKSSLIKNRAIEEQNLISIKKYHWFYLTQTSLQKIQAL